MMQRAVPALMDVHHNRLCYSKERYCGHPRQSGIFNYGNGELVVMHSHAHCRYRVPDDISHSFTTGFASRARILLQRSFDHGETWPQEHEQVVWDESLPLAEKRAVLYRADDLAVPRDEIDLINPDAAVYFTRAAVGPAGTDGQPILECFAFRSGDRGRTWETVPTRVEPPPGRTTVRRDAHPLVQCPDGTLLGITIVHGDDAPSSVALYGSDDSGLTWEYLADVARDPTGWGKPGYADLLLLPSGRLQCYMLYGGQRQAIQMNYSDDGGYSWGEPRPIVAWGQSPWVGRSQSYIWSGARRHGVHYRSPWPLRLRDGRIVVIFGRRKPPYGMGLIVSEDDGMSWSAEAVIRADASGADLGYPVATQLDDGRIFTAYYYMEHDGNNFGGTRHIAGSFLRLT